MILRHRNSQSIFAGLIGAMLIFAGCSASEKQSMWPTDSWPTSSAEEQGIDAVAIDSLVNDIKDGLYGQIDALMIIRNGYAVINERFDQDYETLAAEFDTTSHQYNYYHPNWHPYYEGTDLHSLQSVTKSVMSTALGIAVDKGFLEGANQLVAPFFERFEPYPTNARRDSTRLEDYLTMRSGIEWKTDASFASGEHSTNYLEASQEWVPYVLSQSLDTIPGAVFEYNDGVSVLLGEIVRQATGVRLDYWANEHLFEPIGIDDYYWKITPAGEVDAEGGLYLATEDLARIGYLFLRDGNWNGTQVVSKEWVQESTQTFVTGIPSAPGLSLGYGYQWWKPVWDSHPVQIINGNGYGGQLLFVVPELDVVVVINGWNLYGNAELSIMSAFANIILPAVRPVVSSSN